MAINFIVGDIVVVKQTFVQNTLGNITLSFGGSSRATNVRRTTSLLGSLGATPSEVRETGTVSTFLDDNVTAVVRSYIRVRPQNVSHPLYQSGAGTIIYWEDDQTINNMFELSTAFLMDTQSKLVLNLSGGTIPKASIVRATGFDTSNQLPTIELASAASTNTAAVFGITSEAIPPSGTGDVLVEGHFQGLDTSSFSLNDPVFLSDTPGQISNAAGTATSTFGRVINVGSTTGAIFLKGVIPLNEGAGGGAPGPQGSTGIQGLTGIEGQTGSAGTTGISGNTGAGVQGSQGVTGLSGPTGIQGPVGLGTTGIAGIQGSTGVAGAQGVTGILGIDGQTGIQGETGLGPQGDTGLGAPLTRDTFTGSISNGQTAFTLSQAPVSPSLLQFEINGVVYRDTTWLTISGTTLTWLDVFSVSSSDVIVAVYS